MLSATAVIFQRAKDGSAPGEWEDAAGFDPGSDLHRRARAIVLDGATEAFDSVRWVSQLTDSFLGSMHPAIDRPAIMCWFEQAQHEWLGRAPESFDSVFEEQKFSGQGSFATLLGVELILDGATPEWAAVALGDAVLLHLRDRQLLTAFPPLRAADFGVDPAGISTQPSQLQRMSDGLVFGGGDLAANDQLLLCTDAVAAWALKGAEAGQPPWAELGDIAHPQTFDQLVDRELSGRRLKNDDVTVMRIDLSPVEANVLVVCQP